MITAILNILAAGAQALAAWVKFSDIRERRLLRHEERQLQTDILAAVDAGNERVQLQLQNQLAEVQRDRQALQSPTGASRSERH